MTKKRRHVILSAVLAIALPIALLLVPRALFVLSQTNETCQYYDDYGQCVTTDDENCEEFTYTFVNANGEYETATGIACYYDATPVPTAASSPVP